jgi:cytoskeletal protein CcmA (bactofilin family)
VIKKEQVQHFLGNDTKAEGTLICNGQIRLDGSFTGDISVQGSLMIGTEAMIKADIHATSIYISGEIHGSITVDEVIEIAPLGRVFGKIHAPTLIIDEGAVFDGQCQMSQAEEMRERKLVPIMSDKSDEEPSLDTSPVTSHDEHVAGSKV